MEPQRRAREMQARHSCHFHQADPEHKLRCRRWWFATSAWRTTTAKGWCVQQQSAPAISPRGRLTPTVAANSLSSRPSVCWSRTPSSATPTAPRRRPASSKSTAASECILCVRLAYQERIGTTLQHRARQPEEHAGRCGLSPMPCHRQQRLRFPDEHREAGARLGRSDDNFIRGLPRRVVARLSVRVSALRRLGLYCGRSACSRQRHGARRHSARERRRRHRKIVMLCPFAALSVSLTLKVSPLHMRRRSKTSTRVGRQSLSPM